MKKIHKFILFSVIVIAAALAFTTCINPQFVNPIRPIEGWPSRELLEEYGIADLDTEPVDASDITYWIDSEGILTISYNGTADSYLEVWNFLQGKWTVNPEVPAYNEYIRGISYIVWKNFSPPKNQISIEKDRGIYGKPDQSRMVEYKVDNFPLPENISLPGIFNGPCVSHAIDFKKRVNDDFSVDIIGYQLTIMIYNIEEPNGVDYGQIVKDYLDDLPLEIKGDQYWGSEGKYSYSGGLVSIDFDTRSAPYYYEIDLYKDLEEGILGWPDIDIFHKFGLFDFTEEMLAQIPAMDIIWQITDYDDIEDLEETGGLELVLRFYGDKPQKGEQLGMAESFLLDYFDGITWKDEDVSTPIKVYNRGPASATFDTSYKNYYELYARVRNGAIFGWPGSEIRDLYGIHESSTDWEKMLDEITNNDSLMYCVDTTSSQNPLYIWFQGRSETIDSFMDPYGKYFNETWYSYKPTSEDSSRFSRGAYEGTLNNSGNLYYEIKFLNPEGVFSGWPGDDPINGVPLMEKYTIPDMVKPPNARYIAYSEVIITDPVTDEDTNWFDIKYYDNSANRDTDAASLFKKWCPDGAIENTDIYVRSVYNGFLEAGTSYYDIIVERDKSFTAGWPEDPDVLKDFGLSRDEVITEWDIQPANWQYIAYKYWDGLTPDPNNNNIIPKKSLFFRFYDETDTSAIIKKNYFYEPWEEIKPNTLPKITDYTRGGYRASYDETYSAIYYHKLTFVERDDCKVNWPDYTVRAKFGLIQDDPWLYAPDGAMYVTYVDSDDYPSIPGKSLRIRFYGTTDIETGIHTNDDVQNYFLNWYPDQPGKLFSRTDNNLSFTKENPGAVNSYYEMVFTKNSKTPGWPSNLFESYGLHGLTQIVPFDIEFATYETQTISSTSRKLKIRYFCEEGSGNTVTYYFRNTDTYDPENNWVFNSNDDGETLDLSRGYARAVITQNDLVYYFDLDVNFVIPGTSGWPQSNTLNNFGLNGMTQFANTVYPSYQSKPNDKYGQYMSLMFYRTLASTDTSIETTIGNYFRSNSWTIDAVNSTPDNPRYTKGSNKVSIDFSHRPFYTMDIANTCIRDGWPDLQIPKEQNPPIRGQFGLVDDTWMDPPDESTNVSYIYWDGNTNDPYGGGRPAKSLYLRFTGGVDPEDPTVNTLDHINTSYFNKTWEKISTAGGKTTYRRGGFQAVFDQTQAPFYEIAVTLRTDCKTDWPNSVRTNFGLTDSTWDDVLLDFNYMTYVEVTSPKSLTIRFYGDEDDITGIVSADAIKASYFKSWENKGTAAGKTTYTRGAFQAVFDETGTPYYEIKITPIAGLYTNWATAPRAQFGITDSVWDDVPVDFNFMTYTYSLTAPMNLTIRFYGDEDDITGIVSADAIKASYFKTWENKGTTAGRTTYVRGAYQAVIDETGTPYYTITLTPLTGILTNWATAPRTQFGLTDSVWDDVPLDFSYMTYTYSLTAPMNLTIRFYGEEDDITGQVSVTNIKANYFKTWQTVGTSAGITTYIRGGFQATINETGTPYYTIIVTPISGIMTNWATAPRAQFGIADAVWDDVPIDFNFLTYTYSLTAPINLTMKFYGETDDITGQVNVNNIKANYFGKWEVVSSAGKITTYTRNNFQAVLDENASPYYTLTITPRTGYTVGWPDSATIAAMGLPQPRWDGNISDPNSIPDDAENVVYKYTASPSPQTLEIRLYGTAQTYTHLIGSYFENIDDPWVRASAGVYNKDGVHAVLTTNGSYYIIVFTR